MVFHRDNHTSNTREGDSIDPDERRHPREDAVAAQDPDGDIVIYSLDNPHAWIQSSHAVPMNETR